MWPNLFKRLATSWDKLFPNSGLSPFMILMWSLPRSVLTWSNEILKQAEADEYLEIDYLLWRISEIVMETEYTSIEMSKAVSLSISGAI